MNDDVKNKPLQHGPWPSVNMLAAPLVSRLKSELGALRIGIERMPNGCSVIDAGINTPGGIEAGLRIAEICMGGLGNVTVRSASTAWPLRINVTSSHPLLACLGSQYAGWSLNHGEGKGSFRALGSGPGRALAAREDLFTELNYRDRAHCAVIVLEVEQKPPLEIIDKVAHDCDVSPDQLTFILTPTKSLAGTVQIVARVLEVALHKVHALGFPLDRIVDGAGNAPLPPPSPEFLTSMGRTNDAILFGGHVQLFVDCSDAEAKDLAEQLPSSSSRDYGKPFSQVFKEYKFDFYKIDPMLFAPAQMIVSNVKTGASFRAGAINEKLIDASFSGAA
jgi:methenyltetrahydromethanopterin cyclohydrolase